VNFDVAIAAKLTVIQIFVIIIVIVYYTRKQQYTYKHQRLSTLKAQRIK